MDSWIILLTAALAGALAVLYLKPWRSVDNVKKGRSKSRKGKSKVPDAASKGKQPSKRPGLLQKAGKVAKHSWEKGSLKGHTGELMSVDLNNTTTHCLTCSTDGTIHLWSYSSVVDKSNRHVRLEVEFDMPTVAKFSKDGKYVLAALHDAKKIKVYRFTKEKDTKRHILLDAKDIPTGYSAPIHSLALASNNKFLMTCSTDTALSVWSIKGDLLASVDTGLMVSYRACISPNSKLIMVTGLVAEAKMYAVDYSTAGEFQKLAKAFQLKGHNAGIYSAAFSSDSLKAVTVSKDGTWKLWNIDIRYQASQEAPCLVTGEYPAIKEPIDGVQQHTHVVISPDSAIVVVAAGQSLYFYSAKNAVLIETIEWAHADYITGLEFDIGGEVVLTCSKDKSVKVWTNVAGMKVKVDQLLRRLKTESNALAKERIKQTIKDLKAQVKDVEGDSAAPRPAGD